MHQNGQSEKNTGTPTHEYHTGFPSKKGWYDCRIDGIEMKLYCFICELKPKAPYWVDEFGQKVPEAVEWR